MASRNLGLKELPCIDMDVEDNEAMEIALIENLQRKDLDIFEEADGLQALADIHSYNHEQISDKIGKARSTITEILSIAKIPKKARDIIRETGGFGRSTIIEIAKLKTDEDMIKFAQGYRRSASDPRGYAGPGQVSQGKDQEAQILRLQFRPRGYRQVPAAARIQEADDLQAGDHRRTAGDHRPDPEKGRDPGPQGIGTVDPGGMIDQINRPMAPNLLIMKGLAAFMGRFTILHIS